MKVDQIVADAERSAVITRYNANATDHERKLAAHVVQLCKIVRQPHLYDAEAMTAIYDVLSATATSATPSDHRNWVSDGHAFDRGIEKLRAIYPVQAIEVASPPT